MSFGISRQSAFGKLKSYDRVGLVPDPLDAKFNAATGSYATGDAAIWRGALAAAETWTRDEFFDADNLARRSGGQP